MLILNTFTMMYTTVELHFSIKPLVNAHFRQTPHTSVKCWMDLDLLRIVIYRMQRSIITLNI